MDLIIYKNPQNAVIFPWTNKIADINPNASGINLIPIYTHCMNVIWLIGIVARFINYNCPSIIYRLSDIVLRLSDAFLFHRN